ELHPFTIGPNIHYTFDGSVPTAEDFAYATGEPGHLILETSAVIRARSLTDSTVYTQTYVFPGTMGSNLSIPTSFPDVWIDNAGHETPADYQFDATVAIGGTAPSLYTQSMRALPNVMLTMPPEEFFDPQLGIYTSPLQSGDG